MTTVYFLHNVNKFHFQLESSRSIYSIICGYLIFTTMPPLIDRHNKYSPNIMFYLIDQFVE